MNIKVAFDTASGALLTLGLAGLGFGVYQENLIAGLFGAVSVVLALAVSYARNTWNEKEKSKDVNATVKTIVEDTAKKVRPIVTRRVVTKVAGTPNGQGSAIAGNTTSGQGTDVPKPLFH